MHTDNETGSAVNVADVRGVVADASIASGRCSGGQGESEAPPWFWHDPDDCGGRRHLQELLRGWHRDHSPRHIRSTTTSPADGHADDQSEARNRADAGAGAGLDLTRHDLVQANILTAKASGEVTIRAVAGSKDVRRDD
jgi:hypothetical protein